MIVSIVDEDYIDDKYPTWRSRDANVFRIIGETNDMKALDIIERSYIVTIPYTQIALGAASGGHIEMLCHALSKNQYTESLGYRLLALSQKHGHKNIEEPLIAYFGTKIFDLPD